MRTTRIYYSTELAINTTVVLDKSASHHLIRVLRMTAGAPIIVFNNSQFEYNCVLLDENPKATSILINTLTECHTESSLNLHLLQGVSRGDRMDLVIQKSTELGVSRITPVICERTNINLVAERARKKLDHWRQIVVSACEQSGRSQLAQLTDIGNFGATVELNPPASKLVLDPTADTSLSSLEPGNDIILLVGPEGGLTDTEIELAKSNGFIGVSLGPRILRTETAGIACIAAIQTLWGDLG